MWYARQDVAMANPDKQKAMAKKLEEGKFALRDWREQLSTLMNMWVSQNAAVSFCDRWPIANQGIAVQDHVVNSGAFGRDGGRLGWGRGWKVEANDLYHGFDG
jgi:hypothetical protein